jgi:hypothetical protein
MLESALLVSLNKLSVPTRYDILLNVSGLQLRGLLHGPVVLDGSFPPFRSRGATCRRVSRLWALTSFNDSYAVRNCVMRGRFKLVTWQELRATCRFAFSDS